MLPALRRRRASSVDRQRTPREADPEQRRRVQPQTCEDASAESPNGLRVWNPGTDAGRGRARGRGRM